MFQEGAKNEGCGTGIADFSSRPIDRFRSFGKIQWNHGFIDQIQILTKYHIFVVRDILEKNRRSQGGPAVKGLESASYMVQTCGLFVSWPQALNKCLLMCHKFAAEFFKF